MNDRFQNYRINEDAEKEVLVIMMTSSDSIPQITGIIGNNAEVFGIVRHQVIFQAILDLEQAGLIPEPASVGEQLKKKNELNIVGGAVGLFEMIKSSAEVSENAGHYAELVKEAAIERKLLRIGKQIPAVVQNGELTLTGKLERIESAVFEATGTAGVCQAVLRDQAKEFLGWWDARFDQDEAYEIPTGYPSLDLATLGLHRGEYTIIAGRPSEGKSSFALNIIQYIWRKHRIPTLICSYEESSRAIFMRFAAIITGIPLYEIRAASKGMGTIQRGDDNYKAVIDAITQMSDMDIPLCESFPNIEELALLARRTKAQKGDFILLIDHIQIAPSSSKGQTEYDRISDFSRGLKKIATANDIAVLAVSQLSRDSVRGVKVSRPELHHLRSSGALEQDADNVFFVSSPEIEYEELQVCEAKSVYLAKQRNGWVADIGFQFDKQCLRFKEG